MHDHVEVFMAVVHGALDTVVGFRRAAGGTTSLSAASLVPVAPQSVVAHAVVGEVLKFTVHARVKGTGDAVIHLGRSSSLTAGINIAILNSVTVVPIAAGRVIRGVNGRVRGFVALVESARDTVAKVGQVTRHAPFESRTLLGTVAVLSIVTRRVVGSVQYRVEVFIAGIFRARNPVIGLHRSPRQTTEALVAHFLTVAERPIRAILVVRCVVDYVIDLVARIEGATDEVVLDRRHAGKAVAGIRIASLFAVAEEAVVAGIGAGANPGAIALVIHGADVTIVARPARIPGFLATLTGVGIADVVQAR